jgi:hypothetical protein
MLELEQRLGVTLRAVQMATKQAAQANQAATSASATAESAIDGVMGVEDQVARLMERLATETAPSTD